MKRKFWNWVRNEGQDAFGSDRTLYLDGEISDETWFGDEVTPQLFKDELNAGSGNITLWINSLGGDVFAAAQSYNMLMDYKGDVTVKIDALAASAASVIAMAGTRVCMSPVAMLMVHNPATVAIGDAEEMQKAICKGECCVLPEAVKAGSGIRILRQDLWETVVDFIISQNNNIPRIKGCIEKLSELHGEYAGELRGRKWYAVPTPEKLASLTVEDLAPVRLGYRDKYLIETARRWLEMSPEERLNVGCFTGVGPKVESCIKLFGMHDLESFPIDVWVKRLMNRFFGFDEKDKAGMDDFAKEHFGEYAGLAQQYLFYYIRCLDMNKEKK